MSEEGPAWLVINSLQYSKFCKTRGEFGQAKVPRKRLFLSSDVGPMQLYEGGTISYHKAIRLEQEISLRELAKRYQVSDRMIEKFELEGEIGFITWVKLAPFYGTLEDVTPIYGRVYAEEVERELKHYYDEIIEGGGSSEEASNEILELIEQLQYERRVQGWSKKLRRSSKAIVESLIDQRKKL